MAGWGRGAAQRGLGPTACSSFAAAGSLSSFAPGVAKCRPVRAGLEALLNFSLFTRVLISSYMNVNVLTHPSRNVKSPAVDMRRRISGKPKGKNLITKEVNSIIRTGE